MRLPFHVHLKLGEWELSIGSPANGDVLTFNSTNRTFRNQTLAGAGIAPSTADYLVGTALAGLSAEIVAGATPGGELGGTWGTPTVAATHSGSSHAHLPAGAQVNSVDIVTTTGTQTLTNKTLTDPKLTGNWKLPYTNGSAVVTELALGALNALLQGSGTAAAPAFSSWALTVKYKAADESVVNNTLQDDDDLVVAVAANEIGVFLLIGRWEETAAGVADMIAGFTAPTGAAGGFQRMSNGNINTATAFGGSILEAVGGSQVSGMAYRGYLVNGANAGNLTFQFAQNVTDAAATKVLKGTTLIYVKVAP